MMNKYYVREGRGLVNTLKELAAAAELRGVFSQKPQANERAGAHTRGQPERERCRVPPCSAHYHVLNNIVIIINLNILYLS